MTHALKAAIPDGVKVIILDGAAKVAVIAKRDSTGGIVGERDDAIDFPFKGKCGKFSEIGKP